MEVREQVPLASLTTFHIGGTAAYVLTCNSIEDIQTALTFARERGLPWYLLGGGSNVLAPDSGYNGVIIQIAFKEVSFENTNEVVIGAGVGWDEFVTDATIRNLWGVENLAGIPGTVGGAPVQNIGAYGVEVKDTLVWVEVMHADTNTIERYTKEQCKFAYRESIFKHNKSLIITRVAFALSIVPTPQLSYKDIQIEIEGGAVVETPLQIAEVIRRIRARKFPDITKEGTAGSFFKNLFVSKEKYAALEGQFPGIPGFISGTEIKIPLAWVLDHVLHLRGYSVGPARLYEQHALVVVTTQHATAADVETLATEIEQKVFDATGIQVEREVQTLK